MHKSESHCDFVGAFPNTNGENLGENLENLGKSGDTIHILLLGEFDGIREGAVARGYSNRPLGVGSG
jgi:hypothetical protein